MTPEEIKLLRSIPLDELRNYVKIRDRKSYCIKNQMYAEAAQLRDKEKKIFDRLNDKIEINYSVLSSVTIESIRDLVIDEIVN